MKERPILFSGPMVRALLNGSKTQTRRVLKSQPPEDAGRLIVEHYHPTIVDKHGDESPGIETYGASTVDGDWATPCPYGAPCDRLYVRETWSPDFAAHYPFERAWYAADDDRRHEIDVRDGVRGIYSPESREHVPFRWRPSIHMPRWASRIALEVTDVRVERLHDITDVDALAEGVDRTNTSIPGYARERFTRLWTSISGNESWTADPWVWVIEFKRLG